HDLAFEVQPTSDHQVVELVVDVALPVGHHRLAALGDDADGDGADLLPARIGRSGETVDGQTRPQSDVGTLEWGPRVEFGDEIARRNIVPDGAGGRHRRHPLVAGAMISDRNSGQHYRADPQGWRSNSDRSDRNRTTDGGRPRDLAH